MLKITGELLRRKLAELVNADQPMLYTYNSFYCRGTGGVQTGRVQEGYRRGTGRVQEGYRRGTGGVQEGYSRGTPAVPLLYPSCTPTVPKQK